MGNPNILLIIMDAVRTRNMSIYGYEKETTPMLKKILPQCVSYANAISSSYWTLPSLASIFTGTYVSRHGLVVDGDVLDKKFVTMAEMLRAYGYKTIGLGANPYVSKFSGLHRGFEIFCNPADISFRSRAGAWLDNLLRSHKRAQGEGTATMKITDLEKRERFLDIPSKIFRELGIAKRVLWNISGLFDKYAKTTNNLAFKLIEKVKEEPFFVFIHYNEAHTPYVLPNSFRERFLKSIPRKKPWDINQDYFKFYSGEARMEKSDFCVLRAFYDGAISYLDTRIFEIYSFLEEKELLDNTIVIITSDHGDSFGEHGIMFHVFCLYDTLIKVPLVIKYPDDLGLSGVDSRMVQNTDLLPTIMDILRLDDKELLDQIQGNSLVSSKIRNRNYSYAISELVKPFGLRMRSLRDNLKKYDRKLISMRTSNNKYIWSSDGNDEFYNLQDDPNETYNLIDSQDPIIMELKEKFEPWLMAFHDSCERVQQKIDQKKALGELETETKRRLRSLGYL